MARSSYLTNAYHRAWQSFRSSESTADGRHDTDRWRSHGGHYAACIVRVDGNILQPGLSLLLNDIEQLSGVRVHPGHFMHIMLQELGFVVDEPSQPDEISPARLEEFALAAIEPVSSVAPSSIALGGASAFQDAVFMEVAGGEMLLQIHQRLFDLAALPEVPEYPYLPHCTVAHFTGTISTKAPARTIGRWRNEKFGSMLVSEMEIVMLDTKLPYPSLETYAVIPFDV